MERVAWNVERFALCVVYIINAYSYAMRVARFALRDLEPLSGIEPETFSLPCLPAMLEPRERIGLSTSSLPWKRSATELPGH